MKSHIKLLSTLSLLSLVALGVNACNTSPKAPISSEQKTIVQTAIKAGQFKTLVAALKHTGLDATMNSDGPFTVFAPSDEAFSKLPAGTLESLLKPENKNLLTSILTYHVVSGKVPAKEAMKLQSAGTVNGQRLNISLNDKTLSIGKANVVKADIYCSNGVIHVIDTVMIPSSDSIINTAIKAGSFNTLAAALKAGNLIEALEGKGPFTVFAPTDEAFNKLPKETLTSLLQPENISQLQAILKYHVVSGRIYSPDALKLKEANTLHGSSIKVHVKNGAAMVNESKLIKTDIDASNGVIHVIDTVLIPTT